MSCADQVSRTFESPPEPWTVVTNELIVFGRRVEIGFRLVEPGVDLSAQETADKHHLLSKMEFILKAVLNRGVGPSGKVL